MSQFQNEGVDVDAVLKAMRENRNDDDRRLVSDDDMSVILEGASDHSLEELIEQLEAEEDITFNI